MELDVKTLSGSGSGKMIVGAGNGTTETSGDRCDKEPDFMTWLFKQKR